MSNVGASLVLDQLHACFCIGVEVHHILVLPNSVQAGCREQPLQEVEERMRVPQEDPAELLSYLLPLGVRSVQPHCLDVCLACSVAAEPSYVDANAPNLEVKGRYGGVDQGEQDSGDITIQSLPGQYAKAVELVADECDDILRVTEPELSAAK